MIDPMEATNLQERLLRYRQTLSYYLNQRAMLGSAYAPPGIAHGNREARDEIQQIKIYLRNQGMVVDDQQSDFEEIVDTRGVAAGDFYRTRYQAYRYICKTLQSLAFAVEALWEKASEEHLEIFVDNSKEVYHIMEEYALYFDKEDLKALKQIIKIFKRFRTGKEMLIEIRRDARYADYQYREMMIRRQVSYNRRYKREYDLLFDKIRMSFKDKIS
jgi:hypothetical protein